MNPVLLEIAKRKHIKEKSGKGVDPLFGEADLEDIVMGADVPARDKVREKYMEEELEKELSKL